MSRRSQKIGEEVENLCIGYMRQFFAHVRKIETGWKVLFKNGRPVKAWPIRPVDADFTAVESGTGISVRIEVKARSDKLLHSDLAKHQQQALTDHAAAGGLSFVLWFDIAGGGMYMIPYPSETFRHRTSLTAQEAQALAIEPPKPTGPF